MLIFNIIYKFLGCCLDRPVMSTDAAVIGVYGSCMYLKQFDGWALSGRALSGRELSGREL